MTNPAEKILKGVRKVSHSIKPGDYVFACQWKDADPNDPWYVGLVQSITRDEKGYSLVIRGDPRCRAWKNAKRITKEQGIQIIKTFCHE